MADQSVTMTIASAAPLTVLADGADTAAPAQALNGTAYAAGQRVQVTIRTPLQPLVTGKVETP